MAAALLARYAGDRVRVRSSGTAPADEIHPIVVEAMREVGIDLTGATPMLLSPDEVAASDVVVTMGCGDACPAFPGVRYEDWDLPDPSGRPIEDVRRIRDEIDRRVRALRDQLGSS